VAIPTATNPTSKEILAPKSMREKTSRPKPSVPIRCEEEGDTRIDSISIKFGSYGAMIGANRARKKIIVMIIDPDKAKGFRKIFFIG
jgi:hypothetical protein